VLLRTAVGVGLECTLHVASSTAAEAQRHRHELVVGVGARYSARIDLARLRPRTPHWQPAKHILIPRLPRRPRPSDHRQGPRFHRWAAFWRTVATCYVATPAPPHFCCPHLWTTVWMSTMMRSPSRAGNRAAGPVGRGE
jgi:hypothetical protein